MEIKDYQRRVLEQVDNYIKALNEESETRRIFAVAATNSGRNFSYDVPEKAWERLKIRNIYHPLKNGLDEDTPSICLKVPTGGGKTFLATRCVELINLNYRKERNGLVLW